MRRTLATTAALIGTGTLVLAGCSGGDDTSTDGMPTVVTSTNVWGSVASTVAGDKATVTTLYTNNEGDPHEFEPSAADTATVSDADLVVLNGGHYDQYMEDAIAGTDVPAINAFELLTAEDHAAEDHADEDHADEESGDAHDEAESHDAHAHDESALNEHVFYDLAVVGEVATQVADQLGEIDPANADEFRSNAEQFTTGIDGLRGELATIKADHDGTEVAQTEPLAGYLLAEAGLVDSAPAGFTQSVEEGQSPAAADRAAMEDLLTSGTVHALIYNIQAVDSVTEAVLSVAQSSDVPVVRFTETLPDGTTDYIAWQSAQIEDLSNALGSHDAH
ncbi:ABC transporter substrate-binding protein [Gordonia sp. HNM0687]|uniref:ABC transporter substrate-binding protein n=1 Tax=Gordonia mangrovi TaxID=2665643 RepID=A0A6L7GJB9_9ACTN|nr:zinc ABC transporter substrate-binding protein [Gordonia mangrovi]MXP19984.1 ABC transporter substrate-binding protein [Gordonia mangrovi]UVF79399.1 zinc ABC transporter substrate-binding protein [Gordonia mangrovi]